MVEKPRYPSYAVFHTSVIRQVEEQLLITTARQGTEDAACLYGYVVQDPEGNYVTWVLNAVAAICNASPVMVEVLPETFQRARRLLSEHGQEKQILVGWWHSQPGLGVSPSSEDENSMATYFMHPWNLTVISDPCTGRRAVYAWQEPGRYGHLPYATFVGDPTTYLNLNRCHRPDAREWPLHRRLRG